MSFFDHFPTPKFLEMPAPGLSLTDTGLKFIEIGGNKNNFFVSRFGSADLPRGLIEAGVIQDRESLVRALQNFRKSFKLRYIRTSLPEERSYLFQASVPAVSGSEVRTVVESAIEENVPISISESVFDYSILPAKSEKKDHMDVSVSVIPEAVVSEYLSLFRDAGLVPLHFDVESQAVTKALVPKHDPHVYLIININRTKVGIYIVVQGAVSFTSTFSVESPKFPLSRGQMPEGSLKGLSDRDIFNEHPGLQTIVAEAKKVFLYWKTQGDRTNEKVQPIESILLCGEESPREGLTTFFSKEFGLPVSLGNVWKNLFPIDHYVPPISFKDSLSYTAAVGLAISARHGM